MHNGYTRPPAGNTSDARNAAARAHPHHSRRRRTSFHDSSGRTRARNAHMMLSNTLQPLLHFARTPFFLHHTLHSRCFLLLARADCSPRPRRHEKSGRKPPPTSSTICFASSCRSAAAWPSCSTTCSGGTCSRCLADALDHDDSARSVRTPKLAQRTRLPHAPQRVGGHGALLPRSDRTRRTPCANCQR